MTHRTSQHTIRSTSFTASCAVRTAIITLASLFAGAIQAAATVLPPVVINGVAANTGSAKIRFNRVKGASDYRVFDVANPGTVKYAGQIHLFSNYGSHFAADAYGRVTYPYQQVSDDNGKGPTRLDIPATEIEWNGLLPGKPVTLVVQAVNKPGPMPTGNKANFYNRPVFPAAMDAASMLGSNAGNTSDGLYSINGQGHHTWIPTVLAQSAPVTVVASAAPAALPSGPDAGQVFFDGFDDGMAMFTPVGGVDAANGLMQFSLTDMAGAWDIAYKKADTQASMPMVDRGHLMDVLFDGGTSGTNSPLHEGHCSASFSPRQVFDFSAGRILHVTFEADAHVDLRRWLGVELGPANDPITDFYPLEAPVNNSNHAVFAHIYADHPTLDIFSGSDASGLATGDGLLGGLGQALRSPMRPVQGFQCGHGLDNRSRFDLFFSQTHMAWYEDGILTDECDLPTPLAFAQARVYFTHFVYHTENEIMEVTSQTPWETYWKNNVLYSDERHWDNMGVEVLPATTDWSTLPLRIAVPVFVSH